MKLFCQYDGELPASMIEIFYRIAQKYRQLYEQISEIEDHMSALILNDDKGQRLLEVQGIGSTTAVFYWRGSDTQSS